MRIGTKNADEVGRAREVDVCAWTSIIENCAAMDGVVYSGVRDEFMVAFVSVGPQSRLGVGTSR